MDTVDASALVAVCSKLGDVGLLRLCVPDLRRAGCRAWPIARASPPPGLHCSCTRPPRAPARALHSRDQLVIEWRHRDWARHAAGRHLWAEAPNLCSRYTRTAAQGRHAYSSCAHGSSATAAAAPPPCRLTRPASCASRSPSARVDCGQVGKGKWICHRSRRSVPSRCRVARSASSIDLRPSRKPPPISRFVHCRQHMDTGHKSACDVSHIDLLPVGMC